MTAIRACFVGQPSMGSWRIRAQQLATMRPTWSSRVTLTPDDILDNDVFVFVKRLERSKMAMLRRLGKVVAYDVLDCWRQPEDGLACDSMAKIRAYFRDYFRDLPADGVIFPNRTMLEDLGDLVSRPITIYHHFWPGLEPIEVRERVAIVGYEGEASYLGEWRARIESACASIGARFVVNPTDLRSIDVGFSARSGAHGSLLSHRYKSNVKLANFVGACIPCLVHTSDLSYHETGNEHVRYFTDESEMRSALVALTDVATRRAAHASFRALREAFTIDAIASQYERWFATLLPTGAGNDRAGGDRCLESAAR